MTYTIDYSDGTTFDIPVNTVNSDTSLDLPGKGYRNYGEAINENFLHLLENFAADNEPTNPVVGQLWYDKDAESLKVCDDATSGSETFKTLFIHDEDNLSFSPDSSSRGLSIIGTQRYPQINLINSLDLSSDPNPTNPHRLSEVDFRFNNTADEDYYAGHLRFEIMNATDGSERSRASLSVKTGSEQTDWGGIFFGWDDDSNTAGYGSIHLATSPNTNEIDILLNGQSANFNVAIRPPLLDDDPSSTHSSEVHQSPQEGQIIYNTTSNKLKFYNGSSWSEIGSGGSGSSTFIDLTDTPGSFTADRFLKVNSGGDAIEFATLSSSNIPNLPASKITSGTFSTARLASGGSVDQVLTRTSTGMAWSSVTGGSGAFTDGTNGVYYNGSKNVGIGLTNPTHKLEVDGTISASGEITAYSDERLKENIEKIDSPLDKVLNMRGILYNKIGETEQKMGLIAQEVQEVIPQVVNEGEYLSISYGNLVGLLIEAIKELKDEVNNLKNQEIQ